MDSDKVSKCVEVIESIKTRLGDLDDISKQLRKDRIRLDEVTEELERLQLKMENIIKSCGQEGINDRHSDFTNFLQKHRGLMEKAFNTTKDKNREEDLNMLQGLMDESINDTGHTPTTAQYWNQTLWETMTECTSPKSYVMELTIMWIMILEIDIES